MPEYPPEPEELEEVSAELSLDEFPGLPDPPELLELPDPGADPLPLPEPLPEDEDVEPDEGKVPLPACERNCLNSERLKMRSASCISRCFPV